MKGNNTIIVSNHHSESTCDMTRMTIAMIVNPKIFHNFLLMGLHSMFAQSLFFPSFLKKIRSLQKWTMEHTIQKILKSN